MEKQTYKLGDVCDINSGMSLKSGQIGCGNVPLCAVKSIQDGKIVDKELKRCEVELSGIERKWLIKKEDVLLVKQADRSVGKVSISESNKVLILGQDIFRLHIKTESVIKSKYLFFI